MTALRCVFGYLSVALSLFACSSEQTKPNAAGGASTGGTGTTRSSTKAKGGNSASGVGGSTTAEAAQGGGTATNQGGRPNSSSTKANATGGTASKSSMGGARSTSDGTNEAGTSSVGVGGTPVTRTQAARPAGNQEDCGKWALTDGVCCAQYCKNDNKSESCDGCGGPGSAECEVVNAKACTSGQWPEVGSVSDSESWHYSRSTWFGFTASGACAFGLYGICTTKHKFDTGLAEQCGAFCKAYPDLCKDPPNITLHGNIAAPQGNYYSQFWSSLDGDYDNYLSCGECFEIMRTQKDGTEYQPGDPGYTPPIVFQVVDSCPCAANSKWCCGSGRDHCGEVSDFKYGCPTPPSPTPPADHDPTVDESVHFDLSPIAMARLQTGDSAGFIVDGVIPTKYRRIPCPVPGNMYFWLQPQGNEYYFALSVVNMGGLGAAAKVEARLPDGTWVALKRNSNYTLSRPQERYGTWALPQNSGVFELPITIRVTDGGGHAVVAEGAIKAWAPADASMRETYFIDSGVQFGSQ